MEENQKGKFLGMPIFVSVIFGILLVSALTTYVYVEYNQSFTKVIDVFSNNGSDGNIDETITYTIVGSGDLVNSEITCNKQGDTCISKSGEISLVNSANIDRVCNIVSLVEDGITATTTLGDSINIPAGQSVVFNVVYTATEIGTYSVQTTINCPTV